MALLNPAYGLIVPFLFVVTIPLAVLAGITTTLAFSVLMFRVAVVYIDIAVNMVPQYVTGRRIYSIPRAFASSLLTAPPTAAVAGLPPPPASLSPAESRSGSGRTTPSPTTVAAASRVPARHHRRRRTSGASFASLGSVTPVDDAFTPTTPANGLLAGGSKRASFVMVGPSIGMDRDFEGVGGWRLNGKRITTAAADDDGHHAGGHYDEDDDDDDDAAWTSLNSRLELPLDARHHRRSPSGGGATTPGGGSGDILMMKSPWAAARSMEGSPEYGGGGKRGRERREKGSAWSPNSSRQRTPNGLPLMPPPLTTMDQADGSYFPPLVSPRTARRQI